MISFVVLGFILVTFLFVVVNFFYFLEHERVKTRKRLFRIIEVWTILIVPAFFLALFDLKQINDCCSDSAVFSPGHRIGIYTAIVLYTTSYLVSIFRKEIWPPLAELLLNMFLILGLIINVLLCFHLNTQELGPFLWLFGNLPIIFLLLIRLTEHHRQLTAYLAENEIAVHNFFGKWSLKILNLKPAIKFTALLVLLIPFLILLSLFLLLFGQKPDAMIRAFTDTYKHGFSQLDYMCDNVQCGGHFLCSVGANGHTSLVRPIRYGERNGAKIICNRQLLVSNAFEDLLQENFPNVHRAIRNQYNKVGGMIHRYYSVFEIKLFADLIYIAMKPLEWAFLLTLYTFDTKPENRIHKQYVNTKYRQVIDQMES